MNPASSESKGVCAYCRGHLVFPAAMTGQKTICPHCERETILLPSIKSPEPPKPSGTDETTPKPDFICDPDWANRVPAGPLRACAKIFEGLFGLGYGLIILILVGFFAIVFFVVLLRFIHAAWGH